MKFVFCFILSMAFVQGRSRETWPATPQQQIKWDAATAWKIYHIVDRRAASYSVDTLDGFPSRALNNDSMKTFLSGVRPLVMKNPAWMGYYIASCIVPSGEKRKLLISMYGGFFLDQKSGDYYELPEIVRKDWLSYLSESYETMEAKSQ